MTEEQLLVVKTHAEQAPAGVILARSEDVLWLIAEVERLQSLIPCPACGETGAWHEGDCTNCPSTERPW